MCIKLVITLLVIIIFFMKLTLLDSTHTELSIHAKNSVFMKYLEWNLFLEQVWSHNYFCGRVNQQIFRRNPSMP